MRISAGSVAIVAAMFVASCKPDAKRLGDSSAAARDTTAVVAGVFTVDDFRRLRWMDGRWRGFMADGKTFYEQYRIIDDSTIAMAAFADSTFSKETESSRVQLRGGTVSNDSRTARWVATRLDSTGIDFAPHHGASNHFTWAQESPTAWNATIRWTDKEGRPQTVVYALHKFGR
jgi:hypothetical protein